MCLVISSLKAISLAVAAWQAWWIKYITAGVCTKVKL